MQINVEVHLLEEQFKFRNQCGDVITRQSSQIFKREASFVKLEDVLCNNCYLKIHRCISRKQNFIKGKLLFYKYLL